MNEEWILYEIKCILDNLMCMFFEKLTSLNLIILGKNSICVSLINVTMYLNLIEESKI